MKRKLAATALAVAAATGLGVATAAPASAASTAPATPTAPRCFVTYALYPFLGGWQNTFDWLARGGRNTCW